MPIEMPVLPSNGQTQIFIMVCSEHLLFLGLMWDKTPLHSLMGREGKTPALLTYSAAKGANDFFFLSFQLVWENKMGLNSQ